MQQKEAVREKRPAIGPLAVFLLLCFCIIALETALYVNRTAALNRQTFQELSAVADLKLGQIVEWRGEKLSFASYIMNDSDAVETVTRWGGRHNDAALFTRLLGWMANLRDRGGFANVTLVDEKGSPLASVNKEAYEADSATGSCISFCLTTGMPDICDFHGHRHGNISIELIAPFCLKPGGKKDAALVLDIDPHRLLFPLVQQWPVPSRSAETLLFRRTGGKIEYLNSLRHLKNSKPLYSLPMDKPGLLAAIGARRDSGFAEAVDYRDKPVFGVFRAIPGSSWHLVAKIDKEEVNESIRNLFAVMLGFAAALIACAGLLAAAVNRQQKALHFKALYEAEQRARQSEERFRRMFEQSSVGIALSDKQSVFVTANPAFCAMLGYTEEELKKLTFKNITHPDNLKGDATAVEQLIRGDIKVYKTDKKYLAKSGETVYGALTLSSLRDPQGAHQYSMVILENITEKKRAADALAAERERFFVTLRSIGDGVITTDTAGNVTFMNGVAEQLTGWTLPEASGMPLSGVFTIINEQTREKCENPVEKVLASGGIVGLANHTALVARDGAERVIADSGAPIRDRESKIIGVVLVFRDVTEKKHAEDRIRESEERLRTLTSAAFEGIAVSERGMLLDANDQLLALFGYTRNEFIGKPVSLLVAPADRERVDTAMREGAQEAYQHSCVRKDGTEFPVEVRARMMKIGERKIRVTAIRDITDQKKAAEALTAERERFFVTLRSIGDGVITTDTDGTITFMNKVAEQLTGWRTEDAVHKPLGDIFHIINEQMRVRCENPVEKVLASGGIVGLANHTLLIAKDGRERVIADSGAPIRDRESKIIGVVLVFRDVTDKQRIDDALQKAQRLESLGALAGGIAHDFNNLLGGVFGFMDLALGESKQKKVTDYLTKSMSAMERARALTRQLLTFAKGGAPHRKPGALFPFVEETARFALSGSSVTCVCEAPADLWQCEFDKNQIGQVIDNIVLNGQQAMPQGGVITITAANVVLQGPTAGTLKPGPYVKISIKDGGIGIPAEILPRIFDPFFTTKQKGSGLGLATVYSIMSRHDGRIDVESEPGKGSTFYLFLPALAGIGQQAQGAEARPSAHQGRGTVLVLDDEEVMRDTITGMLASMGYSVDCFADGAAIVRHFAEQTQKGLCFAAIILDLTIPGGMGGETAGAAIRKIDKLVPLFVASGYAEDPILANPAKFGFTDSICKPFIKAELAAMLSKHLK